MRWRFAEESGADAADRRRMLGAIDGWWAAFAEAAPKLDAALESGRPGSFLPSFFSESLGAVDARLAWEIGPGTDGAGHRLVIAPDGAYELQPLVDAIVDRAPTVAGWSFLAGRPPESAETARALVGARLGIESTAEGMRFTGGQHNLVDVEVCVAGKDAESAAFVLTELLLGEPRFRDWAGGISTTRTSGLAGRLRRRGDIVPLGDAPDAFARACAEITATLPATPFHSRSGEIEWSLLRLEPSPRADYPFRDDLLTALTPSVDLFAASHVGPRFASERFSRSGETFCFLKVDRPGGLEGREAEYRGTLEDAVRDALDGSGVGCCIGGGSGLRYSYVDLALTDLAAGIDIVRAAARAANVPARSWIQFFDAVWRSEWLGVYPETPLPPMEEGPS